MFPMETERAGQVLSAREIFDLVRADLESVEKAINVESVASVETVTTIGRHLQQSGGKRLRPALLLLCARFSGGDGKTAIQLRAAGVLRPMSSGAITPACWRVTGSTCRPSRSPCASGISMCSTF